MPGGFEGVILSHHFPQQTINRLDGICPTEHNGLHGIRESSSFMTRYTVYPHGSQTRGSRDFISVGQGARRHYLIQCDPPNHAWQGPGCDTVGNHGSPMASATCVSETVQVWSRLVGEVRADTGRRYRRLWHQRALARAPETLLVRRMPKASIPDREAPDDNGPATPDVAFPAHRVRHCTRSQHRPSLYSSLTGP